MQHTDEPELWAEMKRKEVEYEKRKFKRVQYYESVRHAEQVQIDEIPLPSATEKPTPSALPKINLPPPVLLTNVPPPSILKKPEETAAVSLKILNSTITLLIKKFYRMILKKSQKRKNLQEFLPRHQ